MENTEEEITIPISEQEDAYTALFETRKIAAQIGFDSATEILIATVVSELSSNIVRYASSGRIVIRSISDNGKSGLEILAVDKGPGIHDIELAMTDNFSTTKNSLGLGLSSLKRIMDEYTILSLPNQGTQIVARKWRK